MEYLTDPYVPTIRGYLVSKSAPFFPVCDQCHRPDNVLYATDWVRADGECLSSRFCLPCARRLFGEHLVSRVQLPD